MNPAQCFHCFVRQARFLSPNENSRFAWYGHSVVLMRMNNKTLLIDPMLGSNASPIAPFSTRRFSENTLDLADSFPDIDLLLLTHDHYDHLDLDSIRKLKSKVKKYYVALGIARHLISWGIDQEDIVEFDWWDHQTFEDIRITFTPTRHFSGRGLIDRAQSLWGAGSSKLPMKIFGSVGDGVMEATSKKLVTVWDLLILHLWSVVNTMKTAPNTYVS